MAFSAGCSNENKIPESKYERVWLDFHENLFLLGFQKEVTHSQKISLLQKISRKYFIPLNKMNGYIAKKYPKFYKTLYPKHFRDPKNAKSKKR